MKKNLLNLFLILIIVGLSACQLAPVDIVETKEPVEPILPDQPVKPTEGEMEPEPGEEEMESEPLEPGTVAQSALKRVEAPAVPLTEIDELVSGNTAFALDLYQQLRGKDGNLFYSPYSISLALAMTYAGAREQTAAQMADVMHYTLPQESLHPAFNALDQELARRQRDPEEGMGRGFQLNIANSLWGQEGYPFEEEFLDTLALNYGAGLRLVDYAHAAEEARQKINVWVSDQTEEKIQDLIPQGTLNSLTRLVLANAIYFNAAWESQFQDFMTADEPFTLLDGSQVTVPLMHQTEDFRYGSQNGVQAVELPYEGREMSMVILLPEPDKFVSFEEELNADQLNNILDRMSSVKVDLYMPKFTFESEFMLSNALQAMGMSDAFSMDADFSGMESNKELFISEVIHKAFVDVDEEGTEAAAATAVVMEAKAAPIQEEPVEMRIDHPFLFLIRDRTSTILFIGRVLNPQ